MIALIDYLKARLETVRYLFYGIIVLIFIWSLTVDTSHAHTWMEHYIPGFWMLFALGSVIVLISVARWFSSAGIRQEEDYYDN